MKQDKTTFNRYTGKDKMTIPGGPITKNQKKRQERQYAPVKILTAEEYNNEKKSA